MSNYETAISIAMSPRMQPIVYATAFLIPILYISWRLWRERRLCESRISKQN